MKHLLPLLLVLVLPYTGEGQVQTESVPYTIGGKQYEGYVAFNPRTTSIHPAVLIFHEWWGLTPYIKKRAEQLAELGYVAFAADIYGKGVLATTPKEAQELAMPFYTDRKLFRERATAALEILRKRPHVDPSHIGVIGYCFGGTAALELARSGADIRGVVTFHGVLSTPNPEDAANIKAKILVLTGGDDPNVPPAQVNAFEDEMRKAHVDWQVVSYGGAVHAFTNAAAGNDPSKGAAYNVQADHRSWRAMNDFFQEIFR